jgi:hypothetical protein
VTTNNTGLPALRSYQSAPGQAIIVSVLQGLGLTFTVEMSRQAGKNELSAQLETAIITALAHSPQLSPNPTTIVKAAPTFSPQVQISIRRLQHTLDLANIHHSLDDGHILRTGPASVTFLSAEPTAKVVGHTASPLLEIDEAQDIDTDKFDRDFRPMAAAFNATTVLYGTAWDELGLLHRERQRALALARNDDVQRAFIIPWTVPAAELPAYRAYVEAERERLGPSHPLFTTQYELTPLPGKGRLFPPTLRAQLAGDFPRRVTPPPATTTAAGLDIAGGDDDTPEAHDRTVLTFAAVTPASPAEPLPDNHAAVLHHVTWQGTPHDQLLPQLIDLITTWKPAALTVDATGLGETTARILARRCPRTTVTPLKFTRPSKSELGYALIAAVSTGRLKVYTAHDSDDGTNFWHEIQHARADYLPGRFMNFYVDPSDGHDDYLISLALLQHAASVATPRVARGRTSSL